MPVTPQETAARRYRIEKYLTEGGMGAIYIGKKLGPGGFAKQVVLKQLLPEYTSRPEFRDLFFREAKISATLDHANIVHTFDLVESDQSLFIVMEYVRGADLRTIIRRARHRKRELSPAAAVHIALEILAGLSYAHARRDAHGKSLDIIHRDVSPSNILCSVQGAAKLSDFGIAKASTYSSVFYRVRGKVGYMSPEQARSQPIDHRCDLYSLSVCLYESLTGERLFVGDLNTPADEIYGIPILPPSAKRAGLPKALDDVVGRALAANVEDRYQSAAELADALRTVAHRSGLAFSAPELAAHLRDILGSDPDRWLRDEIPAATAEKQPTTVPSSDLVGTEASSIGIVSDIPQDEPPPSVLSPRAVSGTKDFDLDSMLNDEATRPGRERQAAPAPAAETPGPAAELEGEATDPKPRQGTPAPAWTRSTAPFPLATPKPMRTAPPPIVIRPASSRVNLPGVPAAPPMSPSGTAQNRPLPRATTIRAGAVPPPFLPPSRMPPPPPPPPPPAPVADSLPTVSSTEIEEATPAPPLAGLIGGRASFPQPNGEAHEFGASRSELPVGPPALPMRSPPAPYPAPAVEAAPVLLSQPEVVDFSDAVTGFLPEKSEGPPGWLTIILVAVAAVGGAVLAHKATANDVAALLELEPPARSRQAADSKDDPARATSHQAEAKSDSDRANGEGQGSKAEAALEPSPSGGAAGAMGGALPTQVAPDPGPTIGKRHGGKHAKKAKHGKKHRF